MKSVSAYGTTGPAEPLSQLTISRRDPHPTDVTIAIDYCGVCHSDIHVARSEWGPSRYPCVPGHEIVGRVTAVGDDVRSVSVGDVVGVGCMVDSCGKCTTCERDLEQYCQAGNTMTYGSPDVHLGGYTFGGYSKEVVVTEHFVVPVPASLDPMSAAPLLCAGITSYSPLRHWGVNESTRVGIAGFGGIGEVATKLAKGLGAHTTVLTHSSNKHDAAREAGADAVITMSDPDDVQSHCGSLDFILSTIPRTHDVNPYLDLLDIDGTLVVVGCVEPIQDAVDARKLIGGRKSIAGSVIGGISQTREVLEFCATHNIAPRVARIAIEQINDAYEQMVSSSVSNRFVIDMSTLA